jgi:hypothetical protein
MRRRLPATCGILLLAAALGAAVGCTLTFPAPEQRAGSDTQSQREGDLRIEWQLTRGRESPLVSGYVYNDRAGYRATNVLLVVQGLGTVDDLFSRTTTQVAGDIPPGGRAFFGVGVPSGEGRHRVRVVRVDWRSEGAP